MPDDPNSSQKPISENNSEPTSSQEPTEPAPENAADSELVDVPSEVVKALEDDFEVKSSDIRPSDSIITESPNEQNPVVEQARYETGTEEKPSENEEIQAENKEIRNGGISTESNKPASITPPTNEAQEEKQLEPTPENLKAQTSTNEPLTTSAENSDEARLDIETKPFQLEVNLPEAENEKIPEPAQAEPKIAQPPKQIEVKPLSAVIPVVHKAIGKNMHELQAKEQKAIKNRTRKRLEKIMMLFESEKEITNDEVEKSIHVSDSTATRYLSRLEKEGKVRRNGKRRGKYVSYSKI